jgi:hypothetical protein
MKHLSDENIDALEELDFRLLHNKYRTWYRSIIHEVFSRSKEDGIYYEKHHIIPKSLGGSNKKPNLVLLTAREHFLCHWLLTKMCKYKEDEIKMKTAMQYMMENQKRLGLQPTSWRYTIARKHVSLAMTARNKKMWSDGVFDNRPLPSIETKTKISQTLLGNIPWNKGKSDLPPTIHSQETKDKIRKHRLQHKRVWIKNPKTREYSNILIEESEYYLENGWERGKYQVDAKCVILAST